MRDNSISYNDIVYKMKKTLVAENHINRSKFDINSNLENQEVAVRSENTVDINYTLPIGGSIRISLTNREEISTSKGAIPEINNLQEAQEKRVAERSKTDIENFCGLVARTVNSLTEDGKAEDLCSTFSKCVDEVTRANEERKLRKQSNDYEYLKRYAEFAKEMHDMGYSITLPYQLSELEPEK